MATLQSSATTGATVSSLYDLTNHGLTHLRQVYWNLSNSELAAAAVMRGEGRKFGDGALIIESEEHTPVNPLEKFIVRDAGTKDQIWWGPYDHPLGERTFENVWQRVLAYLQGRDVFVKDGLAGSIGNYQLPVRIITQYATHGILANAVLFDPASDEDLYQFVPEFTVIHVPSFKSVPEIDGTSSDKFVFFDIEKRLCLIGGTTNTRQIRKTVLSILQYVLPREGVLPLNCAASTGSGGRSALFFGLEGTGKIALWADKNRRLIGDAGIAWSDEGIFSLTSGIHSRMVCLDPVMDSPAQYGIAQSGTVINNVEFDSSAGKPVLTPGSFNNTARVAMPFEFIKNSSPGLIGHHPGHIVFVIRDATGTIPAVARLTPQQAVYQFLSGYTSLIPTNASSSNTDPEPLFLAGFGATQLMHRPEKYAERLLNKIKRYGSRCWLINTGWIGNPYDQGDKLDMNIARKLLSAALDGTLDKAMFYRDEDFSFEVPHNFGDLPDVIFNPGQAWNDHEDFLKKRQQLAALFRENLLKFAAHLPDEIVQAGPLLKD